MNLHDKTYKNDTKFKKDPAVQALFMNAKKNGQGGGLSVTP